MIKRFISMAAAISLMASVCPVRLAYAQEVTVDFHSGENIALGKSTSTSYLPGWQYWYTSAGGYPGDTSGGAENNYITDGDINTKNSPRNNPIDYIIDLGQVYTISEIAFYGVCKNLSGTPYISLGISKDSMTESAAVVTEIQGLSDGTEVNSSINTVLSLSVSKEKARYIKLRGSGASSFAMYETFIKGFVIESLQKPSAPAWNGHTLLWGSVAHADSYNVNLYLNNKLFETVCTDATSINFDSSLLYAGDYTADVAADSNADQYSASAFSDKSAPLSVQNIEIENNNLVKDNIALNKGVELEGAYKASYDTADFITDGFVTTSCSSDTAVSGTRYAVIDLENVYSIDDVVLYTDRTEKDIEYDVFTSFDGKNFDKVSLFTEYAPADNGGGSYYKIIGSIAADTKAKYIKIAGNADKLFQISEVVIYGAESDTEILTGSIAQNKQVFCADGNIFWENIDRSVDGDITTQAKCATGGSVTVDLAAAYYLSEIALYTGLSDTDSVISVYGSNEQSNLKKTFLSTALLKGSPIEYVYNKNVDNLDDNNLIPKLICKNSGVLKLKIDSNTKINGEKFGGKMTKLHEGIYEYTLRDDGIVKELKSPQLAGGGTELKYNTLVKMTLPEDNNQIYAAKYLDYMPTEEELKRELNIDEFEQLDDGGYIED